MLKIVYRENVFGAIRNKVSAIKKKNSGRIISFDDK